MTKLSPSEAKKTQREKPDRSRLIIGKVGKPHGLKGEVKINILTDFPERFRGMKEVFVGDTQIAIESVRYQNETVIIHFVGFDSREAAISIRGKYLSVKREDAVPLQADEYYTIDIIGLSVYDEKGELCGTVKDVIFTGSNDVYVVAPPSSCGGHASPDILIPALKSVVTEISLERGRMTVKLPEIMAD